MREKLIEMERATIAAFKAKNDKEFTKFFSKSYVGIANDGKKTSAEEVSGMHKLDLSDVVVEDEAVSFPTSDVGILTYTMKVKASVDGKAMNGNIYTSSVYAKEGDAWRVVLHTESMQA